MSHDMRMTRSRSRRIPRECSRHHPIPPRSPATLSKTHTPPPNTSRRNVLNTRTPEELLINYSQTREQTNQPTLVSLPRTQQNPSSIYKSTNGV
jgi:hypothetical protein